jgi:hypothetical protein
MARLIDADALIEALKTSREHHAETSREESLLRRCENIVREQPTTFNLDEVVWQAQLLSFRLPKEWEGLDGKNRAVMLDDVIDLLKAGGINE